MTTYVLSLGYMANEPYFPCPDHSKIKEVGWEKLKGCFQETCASTQELRADIIACGFQKSECHRGLENETTLDERLEILAESVKDGKTHPAVNDKEKKIEFETNCKTKYQVYRSVIRLVMLKMHRMGLEINVEVS